MNNNLKIGISGVSGVLIGSLGGYLVSRKFHKKTAETIADEVLHEMMPTMFQIMTTMVTGMKDMVSMDGISEMNDEEVLAVYEKILSDAFDFFNLTMKDKYGVTMQLEMHREGKDE
jgi:DNA recombination-dependent growth factor C